MTTMVTELYDALRDAGASDEKARRAAEALANYDDRFNRVDRQIDGLDQKIDRAVLRLEGRIEALDQKLERSVVQLEGKIEGLDQKIDRAVLQLEGKIEAVRADQNLLRWMAGTSVALNVAVLVKLFVH